MAIVDGQRVRALESNAAWCSKTQNNTILGVQTLSNGGSGPSIPNLQQKVNDNTDDITTIDGQITTIQSDITNLQNDVANKQDLSEKDQPLGYAGLDSNGKIAISALPNSVMEYQGLWDADTNTPTLADGVGNNGDVYRVSVAGSQDLGSGSVSYNVGDYIIYNGTIWEKSVGGSRMEVEYRTITGGEATSKSLVLSQTPVAPTMVMLDVIGGSAQEFSVDYTVSGSTVSWDTLGLDTIGIVAGDRFRIFYEVVSS